MRTCQTCEAFLANDDVFCESCGNRVDAYKRKRRTELVPTQRNAGGLPTNKAAMLCYLVPLSAPLIVSLLFYVMASMRDRPDLGPVLMLLFLVGIICSFGFQTYVLLFEPFKSTPFIRFHAFQSIFFSIAAVMIGPCGIGIWLWLVSLIFMIYLAVKANKGLWFGVPVIQQWAMKLARKQPSVTVGQQFIQSAFCPNCDADNSVTNKFCRKCGEALEKKDESLSEM
ncbi:MAG: zinc-ribbon domain-containing protein [Pyrinomonadaceae bacterium]|nr:zinc-ribbon domain-containing protein [Pyrinomonadaceae bacterium]